MKKTEMVLRNTKGITLISLVITIIIMIILAAVTISMVINGGLFEQADEATIRADVTQTKEQIETALMGLIIEKREDEISVAMVKDILDEYTSSYTSDPIVDLSNNRISFPGELYTKKGNEFTLEDTAIFTMDSSDYELGE